VCVCVCVCVFVSVGDLAPIWALAPQKILPIVKCNLVFLHKSYVMEVITEGRDIAGYKFDVILTVHRR